MPRLGAMLREMQRKLAASYDEEEDDDEDGEGDDGGGGDGDDGDGDGDGIDDEGGAAAAAAAAAAGGELGVEAAEASAAALPRSAWRAAARAPPALEKRELAAQVEAVERGVAAEGAGVVLARRAVAEVAAMLERVGEVERMMRRTEFPQALEHAAWLAAEYPQHATLRAIRLDALLEMPSHLDEVSSEQ